MAALITTERLKDRLRVEHDDQDTLLDEVAEEATATVVAYLKRPEHDWIAENLPADIRAVILAVAVRTYDQGGPARLTDEDR